jgi:hypothetical protein
MHRSKYKKRRCSPQITNESVSVTHVSFYRRFVPTVGRQDRYVAIEGVQDPLAKSNIWLDLRARATRQFRRRRA